MRRSGILAHISSLPNAYGIGSLGEEAYQFIDFLHESKQTLWQILPLGPTSFGDSPYMSLSTYAGNPYFIDLEALYLDELLTLDDLESAKTRKYRYVDYKALFNNRYNLLFKAYQNFNINHDAFLEFTKKQSSWLEDYSLFMSLKTTFNNQAYFLWPDKYRLREETAISKYKEDNQESILFWKFCQFYFYRQWHQLKIYAAFKDVKIIGDLPIYVARDSVEVWTNPELFFLDQNLSPTIIAGVPADDFNEDGQLWGNPIYNYEVMEKDNFSWWQNRIKHFEELFDILRIDHFRGFESFYAIEANAKNAKNGIWIKAPGFKLWSEISKNSNLEIIAEDLGFLSDEVHELLDSLGFPGMKVLEFSLLSNNLLDKTSEFSENSLVYPSTHDNPPLKAWLKTLSSYEIAKLNKVLAADNGDNLVTKIINHAYKSKAKYVIIQIQDYLALSNLSRMNTPGTKQNNWRWRLSKNFAQKALVDKLKDLSIKYNRN